MAFEVQGYSFPSLAAAQAAIDSINAGEGFPKGGGDITTSYSKAEQLPDGSYYISPADDITKKYLGDPVTITIPDPVRS